MDSAQVKEFFEQVSGQWDQMHQDLYSTDVIDALAEHSALGPEAHLVDVGTGTGFIAGGLAAHTARVTGTDSSPAMLERARVTSWAWATSLDSRPPSSTSRSTTTPRTPQWQTWCCTTHPTRRR